MVLLIYNNAQVADDAHQQVRVALNAHRGMEIAGTVRLQNVRKTLVSRRVNKTTGIAINRVYVSS